MNLSRGQARLFGWGESAPWLTFARAMPLKTRTFTDEQRAAVIRAQVVDGLSGAETKRRAAAGQLDDLAPFDISEQHVRDLAKGARIQELGKAYEDLGDVERARRVWLSVAFREGLYAERCAVKKPGSVDPKHASEWAKAIDALERKPKPTGPSNGNGQPPIDGGEDPSEAERKALEQRLAKQTAPSSKDTPPNQGNTQRTGPSEADQPTPDRQPPLDTGRQAV